MPRRHVPKSRKPRHFTGFEYIRHYHGFSIKRTQKFRTEKALKRYVDEQIVKLKSHFDLEINKIKATAAAYLKRNPIQFSNIDAQAILDSLEGDMTMPEMRGVVADWRVSIAAICKDLAEEVILVERDDAAAGSGGGALPGLVPTPDPSLPDTLPDDYEFMETENQQAVSLEPAQPPSLIVALPLLPEMRTGEAKKDEKQKAPAEEDVDFASFIDPAFLSSSFDSD